MKYEVNFHNCLIIIEKYKRSFIILAATITVLSIMIIMRLPSTSTVETIKEQNGVYDLTKTSALNDTFVRLEIPSEYYPNIYLSPKNITSAVSKKTSEYKKFKANYLSQRFVVLLPDNANYILTFRLSGRHAMRVFVNGNIAGKTGKLGKTKQETEVWENNITVNAAAQNKKMDIILNSAQFYHAKKGATLADLTISRAGAGKDFLRAESIKGFLVMGALLSAAFSLFGMYIMLARTKATLYFALACLVMVMRECIQSQVWVYFPISGNAAFVLEYLSLVLLTIFLSLYLGQYNLRGFLKFMQYLALTGSVIYGICVLFTDSVFYTSILKYYQIILLCVISCVGGLFLKFPKPSKEQTVALYGMAVFYISATADILMYLDVFGDTKPNEPLSEATMMIFAMAQVFSLYIMNNRVITEARDSKQKLAAEKSALETLDQIKTEFLSNVAHELKTPLTVMSGHAQLIQTQLFGSEYLSSCEKARIISSEADRLALMVGQVLDVTRIEEGSMHLEKTPCHMDELVYQAVETHFPILNKGGNRMEIDVSLDLPTVLVDQCRITQVLVNLIANALMHTNKGLIKVFSWEEAGFLATSVSDTGCGMSNEEISKLFTRFNKKSTEIRQTGTGLGLYICKYLIEEHGGKIKIESAVNNGTTVTFFLPL